LQTKCPPGKKREEAHRYQQIIRKQGDTRHLSNFLFCRNDTSGSVQRTASKTLPLSGPMGLHEASSPCLCSKKKKHFPDQDQTSMCAVSRANTRCPPLILPFQAQTMPCGMVACYAKASTEEELQYVQ